MGITTIEQKQRDIFFKKGLLWCASHKRFEPKELFYKCKDKKQPILASNRRWRVNNDEYAKKKLVNIILDDEGKILYID